MMVRRLLIGLSVLAVVVAGATATQALGYRSPGGHLPSSTAQTSTAKVVKTDLVDRQSFTGTLGYGATSPLANRLSGTVTSEPAVGSKVDRGQALYAVNGKAAYLMFGKVPAYRDLESGVTDGDDVKQLQENLIALGFGQAYNLVADGHFDWYTTDAVKRWQRSLGLTQDGRVPLGLVVFQPAAVRIASWHASVGEQVGPGSPIADVTSTNHLITVNLDARRQTLANVGAAVTITLPNGQNTNGKIAEVGTVATQANGSSTATVPVYITLDDPKAGGSTDQAPVTVGIAGQTAKGALAVPVNALVARTDGSYAIELVRGGRHEFVHVTTGLFAQGMVQVTGDGFAEGDTVVVPAQ